MRKQIILIAYTVLLGLSAIGQQEASFTHYMFNTQAVNPAYAGTRNALTVTGLHRSQWVGFEGAPTTQTLTLHSPILNDQLGLGLSVINDQVGPVSNTSIYGDFAYKLKLSEKGKLSFGLKGGVNLRTIGLSDLYVDEAEDDAFSSNQDSKLLPNVGFGAYYYQERWYIGLSIPKLLENDFTTGGIDLASESRHYYAIAGVVLDLSQDLKFKPTTLMKIVSGAPIQGDLTGTFLYKEQISAGVMLRTGDAIGALLGFQFTKQLNVGYSFDWSYTNSTARYNSGSHEIMLRYDFIYKDRENIFSPRFF